ncbi:AMP-binding protein [Kitasatospora sp. NPDC098652]|uniref:AMP-binding protein n=1 Tax=Kitasatospora sp. NPDC098652 TaxID=3364095 RepID=UPI0037F2893C
MTADPRATDGERAAATLHELVERQARRAPEAVAVRCGGEELTYRELDERAVRLAAHLAGRGLGPGGRAAGRPSHWAGAPRCTSPCWRC